MHEYNNTVYRLYSLYETHTNIYSMLTQEIEAFKRLHDHVMDESDLRHSPLERPSV